MEHELLCERQRDTGRIEAKWTDAGGSVGCFHAGDATCTFGGGEDACCVGRSVSADTMSCLLTTLLLEIVLNHKVTLDKNTVMFVLPSFQDQNSTLDA
jgi:hypothetical protein